MTRVIEHRHDASPGEELFELHVRESPDGEVCACVVAKDGTIISPDEIRDFCRGQIAHYKVPRHVVFLTEFPLTISGKVQKYLLRERAASLLANPDL